MLFKAKECIYTENVSGKRAPVSIFYLKLFSLWKFKLEIASDMDNAFAVMKEKIGFLSGL